MHDILLNIAIYIKKLCALLRGINRGLTEMVIVIGLRRSFICDLPSSTPMADPPKWHKFKKKPFMNLLNDAEQVLFCSLRRDSQTKAKATQRAAASERLAQSVSVTANGP